MAASIKGTLRFGIVAGILLVVVMVAAFEREQESRAADFFARALFEAHVTEYVSYAGTTYQVRNGLIEGGTPAGISVYNILRLAYAKALAHRAPLFSMAGTDPDVLAARVTNLKETAALLGREQEDARSMFLVTHDLYPTSFLAALANLERARLAFLRAGDRSTEEAYELALITALNAYEHDLASFQGAFEAMVPAGTQQYATETKLITRETTLQALETLRQGLHRMQTTASARVRCVRGEVAWCRASELMPVALAAPSGPSNGITALAHAEDIRSLLFAAHGEPKTGEPMVESIESACVRPSRPLIFMPQTATMPLAFLGDLRLLPTNRYADSGFSEYFRAHDVSYIPASSVIYYECPEVGNDYGALYGTLAVRTFAGETPLSSFPTAARAQLQSLETLLASERSVREADARAYLMLGRQLEQEGVLPEAVAEEIDSLSLALAHKSAGFTQFLSTIPRFEASNAALRAQGVSINVSAPYLFFVRSAFPTLFRSVDVAAGVALFQKNTLSETDEPYVFYLSLQDTASLRAQIRHDLSFYYAVHTDAPAPVTP